MNDEAIRELFHVLVKEGTLDEETAEIMLQRVLAILSGYEAESEDR